ncbi:YjbF family lipoprotein [uncultured Sulfitobacter sp.]|uniref:YjbF family lipoprotein n=1 Tax=uncultured Sulfitobacter sp. TaxID=191468 RepID=UPI002601ADD3|nr:YjbF family lipoprotein [uncultured Sulfitobacter sp.]
MMKIASRLVGAGLIAGVLAACSSDTTDQTSLPRVLATTLLSTVQTRRAEPPQQVVVTPESYAKIVIPLLQVNPANTGGSDFLQRAASRRDSTQGKVEVWKSSDDAQIFLRNGVVIGTRGIGRDIIAADANYAVNALRTGASSSGLRSFIVSDGDVTTSEMQYRCDIRNLGSKKIVVVNRSFTTNHFRETCVNTVAGGADLRNEYWVERSTGVVRKSNQWVGPVAGYFEMILLKN